MNLVDQPEKCNIFSSYLRGNAAKKWKMMAYFREHTRTWATVKAYFMKAYKGEAVPDTITHKITKLQQEKKETINDFEHRCAKEIYDVSSWMKLTKMPHLWHSPQHRKKVSQKLHQRNVRFVCQSFLSQWNERCTEGYSHFRCKLGLLVTEYRVRKVNPE
jgi:hypothetical protein